MNAQLEVPWKAVEAIVGADFLRAATPADALDGVAPRMVVEPGNATELAGVLRSAKEANLRVAPRGGGTKLGWGNPPRAVDLILSTRRLDRIIEHTAGDMTATVEAGCTVTDFQKRLAEHNQRLALDPLWQERATIGGILATNDSGTLRARFGALRDLVIGITVALADGTLARSGGRVVKNVAGYDLPKLFTGSMGTLGVITEATFRLHPLPRETRTLSFNVPTFDAMNRFVLAVQDSVLAPTGLQFRVEGRNSSLAVRFEGTAIERQEHRLVEIGLSVGAEHVREASAESEDVWQAREKLWLGTAPALVCKISVLPSLLSHLCGVVAALTSRSRMRFELVGQGIGLCLLRLESTDESTFTGVLNELRSELATSDGSLVAMSYPPALKGLFDVWGDPGDALLLMRRVKEQFDPTGVLNPGRFVGGI